MSKAKFIEVMKSKKSITKNEKCVWLQTDFNTWFIHWNRVNNKFEAGIMRTSKKGYEVNTYFNNSIQFFNTLMNIVKNKNIVVRNLLTLK